jgi:anion-transporting  ArsA/GET3 family ATPase
VYAQRSVVICVGPGGVGKTTCAAALASTAAEQGRRVCVVTIDPSRRLAQALGVDGASDGSVVSVSTEGKGRLDALVLEAAHVLDEVVRACAKDEASARNVLQNPIYRVTAERLGGALEYAAMARLQMLHAEGRYDLVVLDTPPTANALHFLEAPARVRELADNQAARLLAGGSKLSGKILGLGVGVIVGAIQKISGGAFFSDLAQFFRDFAEVIAEFQRRAGDFEELMHSDETGIVLTTSPTEFSVREAAAFLEVLRERGLNLDAVVLNRFDPSLPPAPDLTPLGAVVDVPLDRVGEVYAHARAHGVRAAAARESLQARFPELPVWIAKRRDPPPEGLADLRELGRELFG